jgi:hypothetical protein
VRSGGTPLSYLASTQARDGHYRYSSSSDQTPVWVTGQALMAVNGAAFPLSPVPRAVSNVTGGGSSGGAATGVAAGGGSGAKTKPREKRATAATAGTQTSQEQDPLPLAPASSSDSGGGDDGVPDWLIVLGIVVLGAVAIWAGWVHYRRHLPS